MEILSSTQHEHEFERRLYLFFQLRWIVKILLQLSYQKLRPLRTLKKNLLDLKVRLAIMTSCQRTIKVCKIFFQITFKYVTIKALAIHELSFLKKSLILYIHFYSKYLSVPAEVCPNKKNPFHVCTTYCEERWTPQHHIGQDETLLGKKN